MASPFGLPAPIAETADWIALNKPAGLLSIPDREGREPSLKLLLQERYGKMFTVHRLDRDTSGLILFARNEESHRFLSLVFENRDIQKQYLGLVQGIPFEKEKSIDAPIAPHPAQNGTMVVHRKGKPSLTHYRVLEEFGRFAWMEFDIRTGRTHQIRVHMQYAGHPLVADPVYGDGQPLYLSSLKRNYKLSKYQEEERPLMNRLALHASRIAFTDASGEAISLEAPLPKDLGALLNQLRKTRKS